MTTADLDQAALTTVSPASLAAYARSTGWTKAESYGDNSDVYAAEGLPEIIIPRTQRLGDYASVVRALLDVFASVESRSAMHLYRDLVTGDRDAVRVRVAESDDGSVAIGDGLSLLQGASEMVLAAASSLEMPKPLYARSTNEARHHLSNMRLGQTDQGSFVVTLLTPVISPSVAPTFGERLDLESEPIERRVIKRLISALDATRNAVEQTATGDHAAFFDAVELGVSANLCDAVATVIEPFSDLDIRVTWARTLPTDSISQAVSFGAAHAPILRQASQTFREREPRRDEQLSGFVQRLNRGKDDDDGTITLNTFLDGASRSVAVVLDQTDYEAAIKAHASRSMVALRGDLDRMNRRWRLLNPRLVGVVEANLGEQPELELG